VARQLQRQLERLDLLRETDRTGEVEFRNSLADPEILQRCRQLLAYPFAGGEG